MSDPKLKPGTNHCLCPSCGEYFTTVANFDSHRRGKAQERRCVDPSTLVTKNGDRRFKRNGSGLWAKRANIVDIAGLRRISPNRYMVED